MNIVAAVICCDRKRYSLYDCIKALIKNPEISRIYLNIETPDESDYLQHYAYLANHYDGEFDFDFWQINSSSWRRQRTRDQDNELRLPNIITARNMVIDYAIGKAMDAIWYVDSDVIVEPDTLHKLMSVNRPIAGARIPGRGVHSHAEYVFGVQETNGNIVRAKHGSMGCALIHKDIFQMIRFRQGPHPISRGVWLSEDPALAADAETVWHLTDGWHINTDALVKHADNPDAPLTHDQAINDYEAP